MSDAPRNVPSGQEGMPFGFTPDEMAALYAAGALSVDETTLFESRLHAGDEVYVKAFANVNPVMDTLLNAAAPVAPPKHVLASLMSRIDTESHALHAAPAVTESPAHWSMEAQAESEGEGELVGTTSPGMAQGIKVLRASTGRWYRTGFSGVRMRHLLADRRSNRRTIMLDISPGAALPDHSHAGIEEVFMISGDLRIAGTVLQAGDYIRIDPGAEHGVPWTQDGCVCIVISDYVPFPLTSFFGFAWGALKSLFVGGRKKS